VRVKDDQASIQPTEARWPPPLKANAFNRWRLGQFSSSLGIRAYRYIKLAIFP